MCYVHFDCTHDAQLKNLKHCVDFCEYSVQIYVRHVVWNGKLSDREKPQRRKRMRTIYSSGYETGLTAFQVMCTVDDKLSMRWMHLAFLSIENFNDVFFKTNIRNSIFNGSLDTFTFVSLQFFTFRRILIERIFFSPFFDLNTNQDSFCLKYVDHILALKKTNEYK